MKTIPDFDEKELVGRLREGDEAAFEILYNYYKKRLTGNFLKLLKDDELAKDALQELFTKIWNGRRTVDPELSFKAYLFRVAENQVINAYKRAAHDKKMQESMLLEMEGGYRHIEEDIISAENIALVQAIIKKLPQQQQTAYRLHKIEGKSYKEIEEIMNIAPSTINKHIHSAHKFVKQEIFASPHFAKTVLAALYLANL